MEELAARIVAAVRRAQREAREYSAERIRKCPNIAEGPAAYREWTETYPYKDEEDDFIRPAVQKILEETP